MSAESNCYNAYFSPSGMDRLFGWRAADLHESDWLTLGAHDIEVVAPRIVDDALEIPPFVIRRWGMQYINPRPLVIAFRRLPAGLLRIVAVHNFWVEDSNPILDQCMAGIYLALRRGSDWEAAEDHPIECRTLACLGYVDAGTQRVSPP